MTFSIVKKTAILTGLAGTLLTAAYMIIPAQAQTKACATEIQTIDRTLQSTQLDAELQAKVSGLRQSAISHNTKGDIESCMRDVGKIKLLLGL